MPHTLIRKAGTLRRLPRFALFWLLPLWLLLGVSKALILTISFKRLAAHLGQPMGVAACTPVLDEARQARARQIGQATRLAARYAPWNANCFAQAVAARVLLGLYGIPYALHFGLRREAGADGLQAHAWVAAGPVHVTGGDAFAHYTVVGVYASPELCRR